MAQLNRAQRRLLEKTKGRQATYVVHKLPRLLDEMRVFSAITTMLDQLATGEIEVADGKMIMVCPDEGVLFEVRPALGGWITMWERIGKHYNIAVQLSALKLLFILLNEDDTPLLPEHIEACRVEVEQQRQIFRTCDRQTLRSLANTESIALYMESKAA